MLISSLVGKSVLGRSGEWLGYVLAALPTRDMKKLSCLVCVDGEEEEFCLPARVVRSVGDVVLVAGDRRGERTGGASPLGLPAYTHTGEYLGRVTDLAVGEEASLFVGERAIPVALATFGDTVIVYDSAEARSRAGAGRSGKVTKSERRVCHHGTNHTGEQDKGRRTSPSEGDPATPSSPADHRTSREGSEVDWEGTCPLQSGMDLADLMADSEGVCPTQIGENVVISGARSDGTYPTQEGIGSVGSEGTYPTQVDKGALDSETMCPTQAGKGSGGSEGVPAQVDKGSAGSEVPPVQEGTGSVSSEVSPVQEGTGSVSSEVSPVQVGSGGSVGDSEGTDGGLRGEERRIRIDRVNLLGRRVRRTVFDERGRPVAVAGECVTPAIIARARHSNRLLALTVNTLLVEG